MKTSNSILYKFIFATRHINNLIEPMDAIEYEWPVGAISNIDYLSKHTQFNKLCF